MTGLEKILKVIEEDATKSAEVVIAEATRQAEEITTAAKADSEMKRANIAKQSEIDVKACLSRAESAALLQEKKLILNAKQQMISNVITSSMESLVKLPDKEYFEIIIKMLNKYALDQSGQILFSTKDKQRLPIEFENTIRTALLEKKGASLTISEEMRGFNGGFILIYGNVEENCSFDALFFAAKEDLQDKVCALLFE